MSFGTTSSKKLKMESILCRDEGQRRGIRTNVNALRHGLTTVRRSNPFYAPEIAAIAESMCHPTDKVLYDKALLVAECDITIAQIRRYKHYLIARMEDPDCLRTTQKKLQFIMRRAKSRRMMGRLADKLMYFPRGRSDHPYADFALLMTENWGSPGGIGHAVIRALPDITKITKYETKIWSMRRRRFQQLLAAKAGR